VMDFKRGTRMYGQFLAHASAKACGSSKVL
jgi:hypothetical protein